MQWKSAGRLSTLKPILLRLHHTNCGSRERNWKELVLLEHRVVNNVHLEVLTESEKSLYSSSKWAVESDLELGDAGVN